MVKREREPFLTADSIVSTKKKRSWGLKKHQEEAKFIPSSISSKVLKEALLQQKEIENEAKANDPFSAIAADYPNKEDSDDSEDDLDNTAETEYYYSGNYEEGQVDDEEVQVDEEEERLLEAFISKEAAGLQCSLADIILSKIREKDQGVSSEAQPQPKLDHSVIDLYKKVGNFLSKYTSGKLPKAFKRIPTLRNWVDVLYLTEPEKWSANAMYQATRIFVSNLSPKEAQKFCSLVLLPRVREDIRKNKQLHFSLYQALKKSIYKPAAFIKGILFPLCKSGTCTIREAVILESVMRKISIPSNHPGAALLKLAEMEYCGTTSYFIKVILDKKCCLAYRVLDGLVAHFMRFLEETRVMPVIWHQSLLTFVQRYKTELTKDDKANLGRLVHVQNHYLITPEIKRELNNSHNRGENEDPISMKHATFTAIIEDRFDIPDVPMEED